jgi:hypothetical protein
MSDAVQRDQIIADCAAPKSPHPKMPILPVGPAILNERERRVRNRSISERVSQSLLVLLFVRIQYGKQRCGD